MSMQLETLQPLATVPSRGKLVSVVMPVFNEVAVLRTLTSLVSQAFAESVYEHEIVYVNDGSSDGSAELLDEIAAANNHPVPQQLDRGNLPVCPSQRQQIIPGEQLRASDDHENQSQRKRHAAEHLTGGKTQRRVGFDNHKIERTQADKGSGQYTQH